MNKNITNKKGFTLAELLVVVAIIAVLVAISIPIFTSQLHKARVATDWANLRALYAEIQTQYLTDNDDWSFVADYKFTSSTGGYSFDTITSPNGSILKLEAGGIIFQNKPSASGYAFYYSCDNASSESDYGRNHVLIISSDGVKIGW